MATLQELEANGAIFKYGDDADPGTPDERLLYLSPRMQQWLETKLPNIGSTWKIEVEPAAQVADLFDAFLDGDILAIGHQFKCLNPSQNGVWELKTADIRIFGWFQSKDCFVAHCADSASRIKEFNLYTGYCGEVIRFRDDLDLSPPKFLAGTDPDAVVSNYDFP